MKKLSEEIEKLFSECPKVIDKPYEKNNIKLREGEQEWIIEQVKRLEKTTIEYPLIIPSEGTNEC